MESNRSKISLVVSDVDGTLIDGNKKLTARTLAAVQKLREAFVLATLGSKADCIIDIFSPHISETIITTNIFISCLQATNIFLSVN